MRGRFRALLREEVARMIATLKPFTGISNRCIPITDGGILLLLVYATGMLALSTLAKIGARRRRL